MTYIIGFIAGVIATVTTFAVAINVSTLCWWP
jgi:cyclic lactone autoinducer peptide